MAAVSGANQRQETNSRLAAARIVCRQIESESFPDREMERVVADRGFVMEVVYGVTRWRRSLRWLLRRLVARDPEPRLEALLLTGLYQLLFMTDVEPYAAVNETVEAAKALRGGRSPADMVNAVLRRAGREKEALLKALGAAPFPVRASHPDLLVRRWSGRFGEGPTRALCDWNNLRAEVTLRVRTGKAGPNHVLRALREAGVEARPHPYRPAEFLILPHGARIAALPGYAEGLFTVQDPATALAVERLDPQPGESVLDACAAPGGKTVMIADRMAGRGELVALELHEDRLATLRENLKRTDCAWVRAVKGDITSWKQEGGFDAVLLDAPCSNTGVIRRRPDARWRFTPGRLARLARAQRAMLAAAAGLVRPGGRIVYSTCSLEPEENEDLVAAWAAANPSFRPEKSALLFPPESQTDGAFAALLGRSGRAAPAA